MREVKEETNLTLDPNQLNFYHIDSNPDSAHQNVTITFWSYKSTYAYQTITGAYSEPGEVEDVE